MRACCCCFGVQSVQTDSTERGRFKVKRGRAAKVHMISGVAGRVNGSRVGSDLFERGRGRVFRCAL